MTRFLIRSSVAGLAAAVFVCVLVALEQAWSDQRARDRAAARSHILELVPR